LSATVARTHHFGREMHKRAALCCELPDIQDALQRSGQQRIKLESTQFGFIAFRR
jgi:hypothetical protein